MGFVNASILLFLLVRGYLNKSEIGHEKRPVSRQLTPLCPRCPKGYKQYHC